MKVLMINGSPHKEGNTYIALKEMEKIFTEEGIECEIVHVGNKAIRGCVACRTCAEKGKCVFDDCVNETAPKFEACDGLIIGSPVYYASANGTMVSFLERLFFSTSFDKTMKVGASVVVARRGGLSATFDELNKYFTKTIIPFNAHLGSEDGGTYVTIKKLEPKAGILPGLPLSMKDIEDKKIEGKVSAWLKTVGY